VLLLLPTLCVVSKAVTEREGDTVVLYTEREREREREKERKRKRECVRERKVLRCTIIDDYKSPEADKTYLSLSLSLLSLLSSLLSPLSISLGGDSPLSKWRVHLLKGLVQTAASVHLQRFGE
jgi:hypothetical protein